MSSSHAVPRWQPWLPQPVASPMASRARLWLDAAGLICHVDGGTDAMLGYERTELLAHHVSSVLPALEGNAMTAAADIAPRLTLFGECGVRLKARHATGKDVPCRLRVERIPTDGGPMVCVDLERVEMPQEAGFGTAHSPFARSA
ncbi:MAG: hypothetical protein U1F52_12815 [Burkholderiales bacterium]